MRIRSWHLSILMVAATLMAQTARASLIAYDGFGSSFPVHAGGGTGFSGPWVIGGFDAFAASYALKRESLCFGRQQASGGRVSGGPFEEINGALRTLSQPPGTDNTTVYLSFLLRPQGTLSQGIFGGFFGVTLNGSLGNDVFFGKPGGGALEQYVVETRGGSGQVPSGVPAVLGRTALLVVKAQFLAGNDVLTLHVDPRPGPEPAGGAVKGDLDLGTVSKIGIYSTGDFSVDEIRIGTTYADVVPANAYDSHGDSRECDEDRDEHDHRDR